MDICRDDPNLNSLYRVKNPREIEKTAVATEDKKLIVSFIVVPGSGKASVALKRGSESVLWGDLDQGDAVSFLNYIFRPLTDRQLEDRAKSHGLKPPVK